MNIYITTPNEKKLRELNDWTMSGLVNYLLDQYWKTHEPAELQAVIDDSVKKGPKKFQKTYVKPIPDPTLTGGLITTDFTDKRGSTVTYGLGEPIVKDVKPIVQEAKKNFEFCKHNSVKGLCKLGCK